MVTITIFGIVGLLINCGGRSDGNGSASIQMGGAKQGIALNLTPAVGTFAGTSKGADGTGASARFFLPHGEVTDGAGNLYVADTYNNKIRKIVIATGVVTTLAGTGIPGAADGTGSAATFYYPNGITTDGTNLYVADTYNNKIRQIVIATGVVSSLTGTVNTEMSSGATDGAGSAATFNLPYGITTDGTSLYVTDLSNNKIRQIVINTGVVSSLTGTTNATMSSGAADGAGSAATFSFPSGISTDGSNLYVTDSNNHKIRQIVIATGVVSSLTGTANTTMTPGAVDGAGTAATLAYPYSITTYGGSLYVADLGNNKIRQIVISTGEVSSLTGTANTTSTPGSVDGAGTSATFNMPGGITTDGSNLYVADTDNNQIRTISLSNYVASTLTGTTKNTEGTGAAAGFYQPSGITTDGSNLYVADSFNNKIRKIVIATGEVSTFAGTGVQGAADGMGLNATFSYPYGITTDGRNLYVADSGNNKIRKIVITTGEVSSLTGTPNAWISSGAIDGAGTTASFNRPAGITTDGSNLYVADTYNSKIRQIVIATGVASSLSGSANTMMPPGAQDGAGSTATFSFPSGITTDGTNLYVADTGNSKIRQFVIASGVASTLAGTGVQSATDGAGLGARFVAPYGITTDGINLYVADSGNNKIRKIVIATGVVSSVTGTANTYMFYGAVDGTGAAATFIFPRSITTDGASLYVTDSGNFTIRNIY